MIAACLNEQGARKERENDPLSSTVQARGFAS